MTAAFRRYLRSVLASLGFGERVTRRGGGAGATQKLGRFHRYRPCIDLLEDRIAPAVFHVSTLGSDLAGDGSAANPFRTLQRAVNEAATFADGNDVINLAGGTYNQAGVDLNVTIPNSANISNLSILGGWNSAFTVRDPNTTPTIFAPQTAALATPDLLILDANATVDGFQFQFAAGGLRVVDAGNVRVQNSSLTRVGPADAAGAALIQGVAAGSNLSDFLLANLVIDAGLGVANSNGVLITGSGGFQSINAQLQNLNISNASLVGLGVTNAVTPNLEDVQVTTSGQGVVLVNAASAQLTNAVLTGNTLEGLRVDNTLPNIDLAITNLTLLGNGLEGQLINVNGLNYTSSLGAASDVVQLTPTQIILTRDGSLQQALNLSGLQFLKVELGAGDDEAIFETAFYPYAIIEVNGGVGNDTLTFNATAGNDVIVVHGTTVTINGNTPPVQGPLLQLLNFDAYAINGLGGNDLFIVEALTAPFTLRGGDGDDTFELGLAGSMDLLAVDLVVSGGTGSNLLSFNDQAQIIGNNYIAGGGIANRNGTFSVFYDGITELALNGGSGDDVFSVAPDNQTTFFVAGNPPFLPATPGDTLNLDLSGLTSAQNFITGVGDGIFNFGNALPVGYLSIETLNVTGGLYDLILNLNLTVFGNDGDADVIRAALDAAGTNLLLERLGEPPAYTGLLFRGQASAIRSLTVLGSTDDDTLVVAESAGGLLGQTGGFSGTALGAHLNAPMQFWLAANAQPTNVGLHFDGGPGGNNRLQFELTTQRNARFFADAVAAARSGNVNLGLSGGGNNSQLRVSFANLAPIVFAGAGGTLAVDNTGISGAGDLLTVADDGTPGDGVSQVTSTNPLFETTFFSGYTSLEVLGGTGDQVLVMNGLDSAATETLVILDGSDTFGTDLGSDTLIVRQSAASVLTHLFGGGGDDSFIVGSVGQLVDPILGDVEVYGGPGNDVLTYADQGNLVGHIYTIESTRISRSGGVGEVRYAGLEQLNVHTSQGADEVNIRSTLATTTLFVESNAGNDTFNLSSDAPTNLGHLDDINGTVNLDAGTGVNALNVSDFSSTTANANAVIGFSSITGLAGATDATTINYTATGGSFNLIRVDGSNSSGDSITVANPNGPLLLNTHGGNDTVNVRAISFASNINTGAGNDAINVASDAPANLGNLDAIDATLNLDAGSGTNVLSVSDFSSSTANFNAVIGFSSITGLAGPLDNQIINYLATGGSFSQIRVDGSDLVGDTIAVLNPNGPLLLNTHGGNDSVFLFANSQAVFANGGAGNDEFFLGQADLMDNLLAPISLDGGTGNNSASALDAAQVIGRTYDLVPGQFTRDGGILVSFVNLADFLVTAGSGSDVFNIGPSAETRYFLNGNPPVLPTLPGDVLNLDLTGAADPSLSLGNPGNGLFTFSNRQDIFFESIETINATGGQYDLVVDLNGIPVWGNNGVPDVLEIRLDATGVFLEIARLGLPPDFVGVFFNGQVTAIRSVAVIGSSDDDTLRVREVNGLLPGETGGLNGTAQGAHLNAPMAFFLTQAGASTDVGLSFNGGSGQNRLQFEFTTSRRARFFADIVAAARSGNVNISGTGGTPISALRMAFSNLAPIDFIGAGGDLTVDNTGISGIGDQLTVQDNGIGGDGISQVVSSNALFETTNFSGFDSIVVLGGTGGQSLVMDGLDSAATETLVILDGDDTFGTDVGADSFFIQRSATGVLTQAFGRGGDDQFVVGVLGGVVDNVEGDVEIFGGLGNDSLTYADDGNLVGQTYTIESDRINRTGGVGEVRYAELEQLDVRTSQADDQINILSSLATTPVSVFAGAGNDEFNVSSDAPANLGNLDGIAGALNLDGGPGANVLNVSDFGGTTPNANVVIGFSTITGFAGPSDTTLITYTASGGNFSVINIDGSDLVGEQFTVVGPNGSLNLRTHGGDDLVNVQAILFTANIDTGAGDDTINVSSDAPTNLGNLDGIAATLNLDAGSGSNLLQVSDFSSATANANVVITATQFLNFAGAADDQTINYAATGGSFASIVVNGSNIAGDVFTIQSPNGPLDLFGNGGDDLFNVQSLSFAARIFGGQGDDTYNVSSDAPLNLGNLDSLAARLTLLDDGGTNNRIRISDFSTATSNANVLIGFDLISGLAGAADDQIIDFIAAPGAAFSELTIEGSNNAATAEQYRIESPNAPLTLNLNAGDDVARVQSLVLAAEINGGEGDDLLIASSTGNTFDGHLNDINAPLALHGGAGNNVIHLVDFDGGDNLSINFTANSVAGLAGNANQVTITYSNDVGPGQSLVLNLQGSNTGVDNLNLYSTLAGSTNNLFLNGGDDCFVILSSEASSPGTVNLFGGEGDDEFAFADGAALFDGTIDGGAGVNLLNYVTWTTDVSVNLTTGQATGLLAAGVLAPGRIAPFTIQNIVGGAGNDLLIGDAQNNRIEGRGGNNQIAGEGGDDILVGGPGNDIIMGGPGNDMIYGGGGRDALFGDYVRPGSPVPPIPGATNAGPPGRNVIVLQSCNDLRQGPRGARVIDVGGAPGVRGRIVVARFRRGVLIGPIFVRVGPLVLGPLLPMIQPRYTGQPL